MSRARRRAGRSSTRTRSRRPDAPGARRPEPRRRVRERRQGLHLASRTGHSRPAARGKVQKPFSLVPILNAGTITIRGTLDDADRELQRRRTGHARCVHGRATTWEGMHMSRAAARAAGRGPRARRVDDPGLSPPDGAGGRRRQLVHPQPPAAEPRRRRAFAAGVEYAKNWKACVQTGNLVLEAGHGERDRRRGAAVRGRPRGVRLLDRHAAARFGTRRSRTRRTSTSSSTPPTPTTPTTRTTPTAAWACVADPCYSHTPGTDSISPGGGQWTDVRVKERNLPSIFGGIGLPLPRERRPGARRYPAGAQRAPIPAARGAEQRDHEGAGALLQRVHGGRDHQREDRPRAAPGGRPVGLRLAGRRDAVGSKADVTGAGDKNLVVQPRRSLATTRRAATTCRSARRSGSRAATRSTSTRPARNSSPHGTPTASTGSRRSGSGTTAIPTPSRGSRTST